MTRIKIVTEDSKFARLWLYHDSNPVSFVNIPYGEGFSDRCEEASNILKKQFTDTMQRAWEEAKESVPLIENRCNAKPIEKPAPTPINIHYKSPFFKTRKSNDDGGNAS